MNRDMNPIRSNGELLVKSWTVCPRVLNSRPIAHIDIVISPQLVTANTIEMKTT